VHPSSCGCFTTKILSMDEQIPSLHTPGKWSLDPARLAHHTEGPFAEKKQLPRLANKNVHISELDFLSEMSITQVMIGGVIYSWRRRHFYWSRGHESASCSVVGAAACWPLKSLPHWTTPHAGLVRFSEHHGDRVGGDSEICGSFLTWCDQIHLLEAWLMHMMRTIAVKVLYLKGSSNMYLS
jgi:hypothetical protein